MFVAFVHPLCDSLLQQPEANPGAQVLLLFYMNCLASQRWFCKTWSHTSTIIITWNSVSLCAK